MKENYEDDLDKMVRLTPKEYEEFLKALAIIKKMANDFRDCY